MTKVEKWLAGHPIAAILLAALLGAAVARDVVPSDVQACLDAVLDAAPVEAL